MEENANYRWRVWAPRAKRVELLLCDGERRQAFPMSAEERGYFSFSRDGVSEGQHYFYRLDGGPERPDPASLWQPEGVHRASAVVRPERFAWTDQGWRGPRREDLVFYEIHIGTFTAEGTFDAAISRLDSLRELGITAVEIMPVAQFPGARNWGYDGVHLYAPQNTYGGPYGLQHLVDACHARGLAVFLDVVYNHLGPEGNYLNDFGPYFSDRYRTFWGPAFNYDSSGCDPVRDFILNNVRLWMGAYHFDGLRLDAVNNIYDVGARHILLAIKEAADEAANAQGREAFVIAETDQNDVRILQPAEQGGYKLDGQWHDDFHHTLHVHLTGERQGFYVDFGKTDDFPKLLEQTYVLDGVHSEFRDRRHGGPSGNLLGDRFVVCVHNHDTIGNRARGDRFSRLISPPAQRWAAAMMLLSPHLPLLFMGEEYGEERPFLFFCSFLNPKLIHNVREGRRREFAAFAWQGEVPDPQAESSFHASRPSWEWPEGSSHAGLRNLYQDLLRARRVWPALRDFQNRRATYVSAGGTEVLELIRGGSEATSGKTVQAYFNMTGKPRPLPNSLVGERLFSSEAKRYHGNRSEGDSPTELLPYECVVLGPGDWEKLI